jgi:hypothetical protein
MSRSNPKGGIPDVEEPKRYFSPASPQLYQPAADVFAILDAFRSRAMAYYRPRCMQAWTKPGRPPLLPLLRPIWAPSSLHRASLAALIGLLSIQANFAFPGGSARQSCASAVVENAAVAINVRNSGFILSFPSARARPADHASGFPFRLNANPINPSTTRKAPATISQCGYCRAERASVISPSPLAPVRQDR